MRIVGWGIAVVVGALMTINAAFMLTSPRSWFRLPDWLRTQGSLTEDKYATGRGALTGAVILVAIIWVLSEILSKQG